MWRRIAFFMFLVPFLALAQPPIPRLSDNPTKDVSGDSGINGVNGVSYSGRAGTSSNGRNGGHATEPTPGEDSGSIEITEIRTSDETITVIGVETLPGARNQVPFHETYLIGADGKLHLIARGGDAGNGAWGGNAEGGGKGYTGSGATRWSEAGSGGPGGDGGDGGRGTSGSYGGRGGNVWVGVLEKDAWALMLIQTQVCGGKKGEKGGNGRGGSAGPGGDGGSGCTWMESYQTTEYSDGKPRTVSRQRLRSRSRGSDGYSGSRGRDGNATLGDGDPGEDGLVTYRIRLEDGTIQELNERYDLELVELSYFPEDGNGIVEPSRKIRISGIRVRNPTTMATPKNATILIRLSDSSMIDSDEIELPIEEQIQPGEEVEVQGELTARIRDVAITEAGDRYQANDELHLTALQTRASREYEGFDQNLDDVPITFPVEISRITSIPTVEVGRPFRFLFSAKNISTRAIGSASELKRLLSVHLKLETTGGELTNKEVKLVGPKGELIDFEEGFYEEMAKLDPDEVKTFECVVGITKDAKSYSDAFIRLGMMLGDDAHPNGIPRQWREFRVRVGQSYRKDPSSNFLFIANHSTSRAEVETTRDVIESLGGKMDIWDLSNNGYLDLERELREGGNLLDHFEGQTLIMPTNRFQGSDQEVFASEFLGPKEVQTAGGPFGMGVYLVGPRSEKGLIQRLLNPVAEARPIPMDSVEELIEHFEEVFETEGERDLDEYSAPLASFKNDFVSLDILGTKRKEPTQEDLIREGERLQRTLYRMDPTQRFKVTYHYTPERIRKRWFRSDWKYGTLRVHRLLSASSNHVVDFDVKEEALHTEEFIRSGEYQQALLMAVPFHEKLEMVFRFGHRPGRAPEHFWYNIVRALKVDFGTEISTLVQVGFRQGLSKKEIRQRHKRLSYFIKFQFEKQRDPKDSPLGEFLANMAAEIKYLASAQASWWEHFLPNRRREMVQDVVYDLLDEFVQNSFQSPKAAKKFINVHFSRIKTQMKADRKAEIRAARAKGKKKSSVPNRRDFAMREALSPTTLSGLTTQSEVLQGLNPFTMEAQADRIAELQEEERRQAAKRFEEDHRSALKTLYCDSQVMDLEAKPY